jgi:eukaryotic-like serine/threonine-protein kinase
MESTLHLLLEALQELGEADSALRAKTLGSMSRAVLFIGVQEQAMEYARQAVEVARRVGDPEVLAFTLGCTLYAPWRPDETEEKLACATEMVQLAEAVGDSEIVIEAHSRRLVCLLELGDIQAIDAEIEARVRVDAELQIPSYHHITTGFQAMRALLEGRFAESERLALQAHAIGQRVQSGNAAGSFGVQMFTLV